MDKKFTDAASYSLLNSLGHINKTKVHFDT